MRGKRFTSEQIISILKEADAGMPASGTMPQTRHQRRAPITTGRPSMAI